VENPPETIVRIKEQSDRDGEDPAPRLKPSRTRTKENAYALESPDSESAIKPTQETGYGSLQPTSYWSVTEVREFPILLGHFGKDFEGISNFMKTKTPVMVSSSFFYSCFITLFRGGPIP
jgi:hypothetical protein